MNPWQDKSAEWLAVWEREYARRWRRVDVKYYPARAATDSQKTIQNIVDELDSGALCFWSPPTNAAR